MNYLKAVQVFHQESKNRQKEMNQKNAIKPYRLVIHNYQRKIDVQKIQEHLKLLNCRYSEVKLKEEGGMDIYFQSMSDVLDFERQQYLGQMDCHLRSQEDVEGFSQQQSQQIRSVRKREEYKRQILKRTTSLDFLVEDTDKQTQSVSTGLHFSRVELDVQIIINQQNQSQKNNEWLIPQTIFMSMLLYGCYQAVKKLSQLITNKQC